MLSGSQKSKRPSMNSGSQKLKRPSMNAVLIIRIWQNYDLFHFGGSVALNTARRPKILVSIDSGRHLEHFGEKKIKVKFSNVNYDATSHKSWRNLNFDGF